MRTVTDTAKKMTVLMSKLTHTSLKPPLVSAAEGVDLSALIEDIVAPIRGDRSLQLTVSGGPVPPVLAVRDQIHQVLLNVILNAKQAIGAQGTLSIRLAQSDRAVIVTVDDTGHGIPPGMFERLFHPSQSSRPGGLGVGLYQCKQIVEGHHGTIQIRSAVGQGTQVRIELPLPDLSGRRVTASIVPTTIPASCSGLE